MTKSEILADGEFYTPKKKIKKAIGVPQGFLAPVLYSLHINDAPAAPGIHLVLFVDGTCIYETEKHERRVLCKLQRSLTAIKS
jgi:hypothetical protein